MPSCMKVGHCEWGHHILTRTLGWHRREVSTAKTSEKKRVLKQKGEGSSCLAGSGWKARDVKGPGWWLQGTIEGFQAGKWKCLLCSELTLAERAVPRGMARLEAG